MIAWVLVAILAPSAIAAFRYDLEALGLMALFVLFSVLHWVFVLLVERRTTFLNRRRVAVGGEALLVGLKRFPYSELLRVGASDGMLALELKRTRVMVALEGDLEPAAKILAERLATARPELRVDPELPPWATRRAQKRAALVLFASSALVLALALGAALAPVSVAGPAFERLGLVSDVCAADREGNYIRLLCRKGDGRPCFLFAQTGTPGEFVYRNDRIRVSAFLLSIGYREDVLADLARHSGHGAAGEPFTFPVGTTVLHLAGGGHVVASSEEIPVEARAILEKADASSGIGDSLPVLLEGLLPRLPREGNSVLRDFILGRASRRCHDVVDGTGERLVWGSDRGTVVFVAVELAALGIDVYQFGFHHKVAGTHQLVIGDKSKNVFFLGQGGRYADASVSLPAFDDLLEATEQVRSGKSVREALARFSLPLPVESK